MGFDGKQLDDRSVKPVKLITTGYTPSDDGDVTTVAYVSALLEGLKPKEACVAATTANIADLSSVPALMDDVTLADGNRVLVKDQTDPIQNGVYVYTAGVLARATDFDDVGGNDVVEGTFIFVGGGTINGGSGWFVSGTASSGIDVVVGTDPVVWSKRSDTVAYNQGSGIAITGNVISVDFGDGFDIASNKLIHKLASGGALQANTNGLAVVPNGVNTTHISFGNNANDVNASSIPLDTSGTYTGTATNIMDALEEIQGNQSTPGSGLSLDTNNIDLGGALTKNAILAVTPDISLSITDGTNTNFQVGKFTVPGGTEDRVLMGFGGAIQDASYASLNLINNQGTGAGDNSSLNFNYSKATGAAGRNSITGLISAADTISIMTALSASATDRVFSQISMANNAFSLMHRDENTAGGVEKEASITIQEAGGVNLRSLFRDATPTPDQEAYFIVKFDGIEAHQETNNGIRYTGFGETDIDTQGAADYNSLKFNSLTPKAYVDQIVTNFTGNNGDVMLNDGTGAIAGSARLNYDTTNNNLKFGNNIATSGALLTDNFFFGTDINAVANTSAIRWSIVMGEGHDLITNDTTVADRIANIAIIGGFNNKIQFDEDTVGVNNVFIASSANCNVNAGGGANNFNYAFLSGNRTDINANQGIAFGNKGQVDGEGGIVFAFDADLNGFVVGSGPKVLSAGRHAINMSANSSAQTVGHGALGNYGGIFGGLNGNIPVDSPQSIILGGENIKAAAATANTVFIPKLWIGQGDNATIATGAAADELLVVDSNGEIKKIAQGAVGFTLANGNGTTANGNAVDLGGTYGSSINLKSGVAANAFVIESSQATGANSVAVRDASIILTEGLATNGGTLTMSSGSTIINSVDGTQNVSFRVSTGNFLMVDNRTTARGIEYSADYSSSFTDRSLVDKGYVDTQLNAAVSTPNTLDRNLNPSATTGNGANSGVSISRAPKGLVVVAINGIMVSLGNGSTTTTCYFSADGTTPRLFNEIVAGDTLYFNGIVAGYDLDTDDRIDIIYL